MNIRSFFSLNLYNLSVLIKRRHSLLNKSKLFRDFLRITVKDIFCVKIFKRKLNSEKISDKIVHFADYEFLRSLFEEIFIEEQYMFFTNQKNPFIIDCGTNIGMAVHYFKTVYPDSKILCFEPDPVAFDFLLRNIKSNNYENVEAHQNAVAGTKGELDFFVEAGHETSLSMSLYDESFEKKNMWGKNSR